MPTPKIFRVSPTVTAALQTANTVVGGTLTFAGVPNKGFIVSVSIVDQSKSAGAYQLVFFDSIPTNITDTSAFDIADADMFKIVGAVHITDVAGANAFGFADNKLYCRQALVLPYRLASGSTSLYAFLITIGTPTYAAITDVQVHLGIDG